MTKIKHVLSRGVEEIIVKKDLEKKLNSGKKLRIKLGIDPTGPKIHIGRAVQLWKLKEFQELGHKIILIIGDFTTLIGDASDKQSKRPILTKKQVEQNMKDYLPQIGRIIDLKKTEVHYNSEWLGKLKALDLINLSMHFTAQQMIQRRNFKERWDQKKPIGFHELNYPLLQGYDSVAIKADIEIGGSDQLFNLKAGRVIQEVFKQNPQDIMTTKMLIGPDGRKMSTSWGNVINILDDPNNMFGKIMSMKDEVMPEYFELATRLPEHEIKNILNQEPQIAKRRLACEITKLYHGKEKAEQAQEEFNKIFRDKKIPDNIQEFKVKKNYNLVEVLVQTKLASSKSDAKRLIKQNAVKKHKNNILQVGKRGFAKLIN